MPGVVAIAPGPHMIGMASGTKAMSPFCPAGWGATIDAPEKSQK